MQTVQAECLWEICHNWVPQKNCQSDLNPNYCPCEDILVCEIEMFEIKCSLWFHCPKLTRIVWFQNLVFSLTIFSFWHILTQIALSQWIFVHLTRTACLASCTFSRCKCTRLCLFITSFSSSQLIFLASVSLALSAFSTLGEEVSSQPREGISSVLQNKILIIVFVFSFSMKINMSKVLLHSCLMTQD